MLKQSGFGYYFRKMLRTWKETGTLAHIVHRVTGILLVVYLVMHIYVVTRASLDGDTYTSILETFRDPLFAAGELILIMGGLIHGLNGIRLTLFDMGIGLKHQKAMFWAFMVVAVVIWFIGLAIIWPMLGGG
jgi:succinate dehydrogenase / fumarate reductase cytochrome b subunit